jgi:tRNA-dihydrouridine synthase
VPKIAKHNAGCSLMREPEQAARVVEAMVGAVDIPVTVKMRAGWTDSDRNAPTLARMVQDAGASAITIHGRTAEQSYNGHADWELVSRVARDLRIPVFGSGDCVEPEQIVERMKTGVSGVLVGRGVLRNPWILAQAADLVAGGEARTVTMRERGQFLLDYIDLLLDQRDLEPQGFRHVAPGGLQISAPATGHERWVINKLRALCAWYSKGLDSGSHLRVAVNRAESIAHLRQIVEDFFITAPAPV